MSGAAAASAAADAVRRRIGDIEPAAAIILGSFLGWFMAGRALAPLTVDQPMLAEDIRRVVSDTGCCLGRETKALVSRGNDPPGADEKQTGTGVVSEVQAEFAIMTVTGKALAKDTIRKP